MYDFQALTALVFITLYVILARDPFIPFFGIMLALLLTPLSPPIAILGFLVLLPLALNTAVPPMDRH
jgi:hypothetical protein